MMAGIVCGAEMVLVPEVPVTVEDIARAVDDAYRRGKTHAIIVLAEGANLRAVDLAKMLEAMDVGFSTRVTILGHIQRGGTPTAFDRMLAARMGARAVEALLEGSTDVMTALHGRTIELLPLGDVIANQQPADLEYYHMARMLAR
jgi:6-phosphofructokinase 1